MLGWLFGNSDSDEDYWPPITEQTETLPDGYSEWPNYERRRAYSIFTRQMILTSHLSGAVCPARK
jgi:hypothetical protein